MLYSFDVIVDPQLLASQFSVVELNFNVRGFNLLFTTFYVFGVNHSADSVVEVGKSIMQGPFTHLDFTFNRIGGHWENDRLLLDFSREIIYFLFPILSSSMALTALNLRCNRQTAAQSILLREFLY